MNACSCLTLILACIVYWQAREIDRVLNECDAGGNGINVSLLEHVSPIEWENVVLYGVYLMTRISSIRTALRAYFYTDMGNTL